jgi:uroporphyrinogen-III synthase
MLREKGWPNVSVPDTHDAASLAEMIISKSAPSARMLFLKGEQSLPILEEKLRQAGFDVEAIAVYRTVPVAAAQIRTAVAVIRNQADGIVVGSPSGVDVLFDAVSLGSLDDLKPGLCWFCLGKSTAQRLRERGISEPCIATELSPEVYIQAFGPHHHHYC